MKTIEEVISEFKRIMPLIEIKKPDRLFQLKNSIKILEWKLNGQNGLSYDHMIEPANKLLDEYLEQLEIKEKQMELFT